MNRILSTSILNIVAVTVIAGHCYACNQSPVAVISEPKPKYVCESDTVGFVGSNSFDPDGSITEYDWDWPEGASSVMWDGTATPNCVFESAGIYGVRLRVQDNDDRWSTWSTCAVCVATDEKRVHNITTQPEKGYTHIQLAIDDADTNDELVVQRGIYDEIIDFKGKSLILQSTNPDDWEVVGNTIIDAGGLGCTVRFYSGEGSNSVLKGFTITGATGDFNKGIYCDDGMISNCKIIGNEYGIFCCCEDANLSINNCIIQSNVVIGLVLSGSETLSNCVVQNNGSIGVGFGYYDGTMTNCTIYDNGDYGVYCDYDSSPTITNCTIVNNEPGGLYVDDSSSVTVYNSILWDNSPDQIDGSGTATVTYSCVQGDHPGTGNISSDPCFVDSAAEDYRINPDSRCIDAGTDNGDMPAFDIVGTERPFDYPGVEGDKYDMGAYEAVSMVGFWKLDGNADDSSLNNNNGSVGGDPVFKPNGGVMYGALQFDGGDDFITISDQEYYDTNNNFTWSAWMRTLKTDGDDKVITDGGVIMAHCPTSGTENVKCLYVDSDGKLKFVGGGSSLESERKVNDGLWHLVAVTIEFAEGDDTVKLYIDGVDKDGNPDADNEGAWEVTDNPANKVLRIGYANGNYGTCFDGRIDDVRVYNYVLTLDQINDLYEKSGYWRFVVTCDSRDDITYHDADDPSEYDGVNNKRLQEIANAIIAEKAELVLFPGDLVNSGTTTQLNRWRYGDSHGNDLMEDVYDEEITVMPIRGNHDLSGNWKSVFPEIPGEGEDGEGPDGDEGFTYYIEHRNALFVAIDVYRGTDEVDEQIRNWLSTTLGNSDKEHVFVATHEPAFEVNHSWCLNDHKNDRDAFWHILEDESRCRLYFCGHDHFYNHARIDDGVPGTPESKDVHQMLVGTAGAPLKIWDGDYAKDKEDSDPWVPTKIENEDKEKGFYCYGYVVVEVWGDNVTTHWKRRANVDSHYPPSNYVPGGGDNNGDVFEYSVP